MERENVELYPYQSCYLIFKRYIFLKRKESKHISFNRLKAFIKNVANTENQIASRKQEVDIYYKK